jgi:hypothetical protein
MTCGELDSIEQNVVQREAPTITVAEQLEKMASLLDRGLLTLDEFNAQKRMLLAATNRHTGVLPPFSKVTHHPSQVCVW